MKDVGKGYNCYWQSRFYFIFRKQIFFLFEVKTCNSVCAKMESKPQQKKQYYLPEKMEGHNHFFQMKIFIY